MVSIFSLILLDIGIVCLFLLNENKKRRLQLPKEEAKKKIKVLKGKISNKRNQMQIGEEIYEGISFLRNIISIDRGKQVGTDVVIEQLAERDGLLQSTYIRMLSYIRLNKKKEAGKIMSEKVDSPMGKEYGALLLKWDEIPPTELSETLLSLQKSFKEVRLTQQKKRDETVSDALYFPVVVNTVLIFINFIYVGYFINQKEMLESFF